LNLYSIFIFFLGLLGTYFITQKVQQTELEDQRNEINIQSQAITHNIQQQIFRHTQLLTLTAGRWTSIEQINRHWKQDIYKLKGLLPQISNVNIYLIEKQPRLTIGNQLLRYFANDHEIIHQARQLLPLAREMDKNQDISTQLSTHHLLENNQAISYLHTPIFDGQSLIGYLEVTLNISQLLDHQVARFQLTHPFSLSEFGSTIYSVLPKGVEVQNVEQQFSIPLLGHQWKLMVWPLHQHNFYQYVAYIGVLFSILLSQVCFVVLKNKKIQRQIKRQQSHLSTINKDVSANKSKLVQSNKLYSLGEIATGIAHEINQPLQVICIHAEMCHENLEQQNYALVDSSFHAILAQVERIEKIVKQVGSFARDSGLDKYHEEAPINIFENVINIVINQFNQQNVDLRQVLPASLPPILCNETQIEQVLVNLLINAKDAVEDSDEKIVFIKAHDKQGKLYIEVSDTGCGIEPNKQEEIFTPFYTTKALGKGTGLGLSISYSIIHQHKGELEVSSEVGKGSTFTVILPLS